MCGLFLYFLRLGSTGFGGPIALAGYMRRDLVDERRWYSDDEYQQGLAIAQTMPGPLAAQLAMWLGYLERGARGAAVVSIPFVVPSFVLVTTVAILYAHYQRLAVVQDVFAAGLFGAIRYGGGLPRFRMGTAALVPWPLAVVRGFAWLDAGGSLGTMAGFFAKASAFTVGSGLAMVPFLHQGLVSDHHWLTEQQFTDMVAMGLISPGPVVIMSTFAGYLVAGIAGAVVATVAVFLPVYLFVVVPGRLFRRIERHPRVRGFVTGATAAAAGAIAGAAVVIGRQTIKGNQWWLSLLIGLVALALLLQKRKKIPEPLIVVATAVAGIALHH